MEKHMMERFLAGILVGFVTLIPYLLRLKRHKTLDDIPPHLPSQSLPSANKPAPQTPPRPKMQSLRPPFSSPRKTSHVSAQDCDQVEILLHNVSHTDMVLSIPDSRSSSGEGESIIARPKFSCFREISTKIENKIRDVKLENLNTIRHPVYSRDTNALHSIIRNLTSEQELDVGFDLQRHNVVIEDIGQLRFRQNDRDKMSDHEQVMPTLSAVYFPLLSMLIPKWLNEVESRGKGNSRKIVFLVSGQGTPRDETARVQDNSTEITAIVMEMFLKKVYPFLEVIQVPSPTINLFRYADNIVFVKRMLKPKLDAIRNDLAARIGGKWIENFHVTMSFADGSSARISAISASIRSYRPSYMHFWQLKTFWYETKICMDDIECHSYDEISASPPMQIANVDDRVKLVVEEMLRFKEEFKRIRQLGVGEQDLGSFWLRKTKKPVLAVLLVQKFGTNEEPRLYRGTNMEVSMPTGSLCAERNVIGSALAADLALRREDIRCVAVLSLSLEQPSTPLLCGECGTNEDEEDGSEGPMSPLILNSKSLTPQTSTASAPSSTLDDFPARPADMRRAMSQPAVISHQNHSGGPGTPNKTKVVNILDMPNPTLFTPNQQNESRRHRESSRKVDENLKSRGRESMRSAIRQFPHSRIAVEESMNPLKPCGACHEWLKKIAEVNPSFSVITFTDSECQGVYVEQIDMM